MKDTLGLYTYFKHWLEYDSIWVYSDPHFGDLDCYKRRFPEEFANSTQAEDKLIVARLDEMQIKNINSKCGRKSCLIILGDVGSTDCIKKLRAAYKVLITGNHDAGVSNYKRKIETKKIKFALTKDQREAEHKILTDWGTIDGPGDWAAIQCEQRKYIDKCILENFKSLNILDAKVIRNQKGDILVKYENKTDTWYYFVETDNKLFDEVVDGKLQITSKITLSHIPDIDEHTFNIHGHVHSKYTEINGFNCCAEAINYKPVLLTEIVNCKLSKIVSLTRFATDTAIERKKSKTK